MPPTNNFGLLNGSINLAKSTERSHLLRQSYQDAVIIGEDVRKSVGGLSVITQQIIGRPVSKRSENDKAASSKFNIVVQESQNNLQIRDLDNSNTLNPETSLIQQSVVSSTVNNQLGGSSAFQNSNFLNINNSYFESKSGQSDFDQQNQTSTGFLFNSILLKSGDKLISYTQYSGSRKGSDLKSERYDSKQASFNTEMEDMSKQSLEEQKELFFDQESDDGAVSDFEEKQQRKIIIPKNEKA